MYRLIYIITLLISLSSIVISLSCDTPLNPPERYNAQPPLNLIGVFKNGAVVLNWESSEGKHEVGYEIWKSIGNYIEYYLCGTFIGEIYTYTDRDIELDEYYLYKVRTIYKGFEGEFSDYVRVNCNTQPIELSREFTGDSVILSWTPAFGGTETGYEVWRCEGFDHEEDDYSKLTNTDAGIVEFTDTDVGRGKRYWYKVRAVYGTVFGDFSNEIRKFIGYTWIAKKDTSTIYKIDYDTADIISSFGINYPYPYGVAWDGDYIWNINGSNDTINKFDPNSGVLIHSINAPSSGSFGLTWDGSYLWTIDYATMDVYQINPDTGSTISTFAIPDTWYTDAMGITFDGEYLWILVHEHDSEGYLIGTYLYQYTTAGTLIQQSNVLSGADWLAYDGELLLSYYWSYYVNYIIGIDPLTGNTCFSVELWDNYSWHYSGIAVEY